MFEQAFGYIQNLFLVQTRVVDQLQLDREKLYHLFEDVEASYHANVPYHNAVHATDVLQGVYYALRRPSEGFRLLDRLTPDETFSLVLAALGHDVNHMGRTNHFLRSSDHHLTKVNGDSPNESMHYRIFIQKVYKWVCFSTRSLLQNAKIFFVENFRRFCAGT